MFNGLKRSWRKIGGYLDRHALLITYFEFHINVLAVFACFDNYTTMVSSQVPAAQWLAAPHLPSFRKR